jgi:tetratricopeptide (TPR) repeat protein
MFFNKDIYRKLRPYTNKPLDFKSILDVEYNEALLYPRFKFLDTEKPKFQNGIFETSDYKKLLEVIGSITLSVGSIFSYSKNNYEISSITVEILDIVIDYSNGHTDYYIGNAIPFQIEIHVLAKKISFWDITLGFAKKVSKLANKKDLSSKEEVEFITSKSKAENCFQEIISNFDSDPRSSEIAAEIYKHYGIFKSDCGDYQAAISLFSKALELEPSNAEFHFFIGYEYGLLDNEDLAIQFLKKAVELGSKDAKDYLEKNY